MKKSQKILFGVLCVFALAAILGITWMTASRVTSAQIYEELQAMPVTNKTSEISAYLGRYFIDDYDEEKLADAAASAMVTATGDRWSYYLTASEYEAYKETMNNAYVGIGITIIVDEDAGGLRIESVTADSPAYKAGLQVGDIILEAEGQKTIELGTTGTRDIVRGEEGTSVHLKVQRGDETFECDVLRESIKVDVATCRMLENDIGYVKINNFDTRCFEETSACIDELLSQGAKALLFDVRFNGGGYKDEMVKLLDKLLPEGTVFQSEDYAGKTQTDTSDSACIELPMVVLVNRDSYSAAEFFAAALQEYDWAKVVGEKTCGKGNFQTGFPLSDGSYLNISIGKYYTPQGRSLTDIGVTPDEEIEYDDETYAKLYYGQLSDAEDTQLQAAIGILTDEIS